MWNFLCSSNVKIRFGKKKKQQKIRYKVELKRSTDEEGMGYGHHQVG